MAPLVPAKYNTGATGCADGRGNEGVSEINALLRQSVKIRCMDEFIALVSQGIPTLIVRQDEDHVGPGLCPERQYGQKKKEKAYGEVPFHTGELTFVNFLVIEMDTKCFGSVNMPPSEIGVNSWA